MKINWLLFVFAFSSGCHWQPAELGSQQNPIKIFFVPSVEYQVLEDSSQQIRKILQDETGLHFTIKIPTSFIAVVEAFGSGQADIAALNTFGYLRAHEKYGAQAKLTVLRYGQSHYRSQILVHKDSKIKNLKDLNGKKMAFVDPTSASGYLLPLKILKEEKIQLAKTVFAMKHDNVVDMIYQKKVDAGATFHIPVQNKEVQDARRLVLKQYPDVMDKVRVLKVSQPLPNEPLVFRKDLPEDLKEKLVSAFLQLAKKPEGKEALQKIASVTQLKPSSDKDYEGVREMLKDLGKEKERH